MSGGESTDIHGGDGEFYISPSGRIHWNQPPFDRCFEAGQGSGLFAVATAEWPVGAGSVAFFIRSLVREALTRFAHSCAENPSDDERALQSLLPSSSRVVHSVEALPPVKGGEYVTGQVVRQWHDMLMEHIRGELEKRKVSASQWVQGLGEPWNRIGRVFFHLAENRDDLTGSRPFAFLATFAHKSTTGGELSHLPLGRAVQLYHDDHRALLALLQPLKEAAVESPLLKEVLDNGDIYAPMAWDAQKARDFLHDVPVFEKAGIIVRMVNLWKKQPQKLQLAVAADRKEEDGREGRSFSVHSMLSFSVSAVLGGRRLSPDELEALLASDGGLLRFNGEWVDVDAGKIRQLLERWRQAVGMMNRLGIPLIQGLRLLVGGSSARLQGLPPDDPDCRMEMGERLSEAMKTFEGAGSGSALTLRGTLDGVLRPYQRDGVSFLHRMTEAGFGACLADDMGLGKTLQCLAWLSLLHTRGEFDSLPAVIVVPASLLENWREEIEKFAPELNPVVLHPATMAGSDWRHLAKSPEEWLRRYDVAITTYGMTTRLSWLKELEFPALVLDEAQAVKNNASQRTRAVRGLVSPRKVALSGTPVENSLSELWSLMDILNPGLLGSRDEFDSFTKGMGTDYSPLRKLVHPFILRRMKTDPALIPDLPDKSEMASYCSLTPWQAALYKSQVDALHAVLEEPDPSARLMLILPFLSRFKQICNHPAQFLGRGAFDTPESGKFMRLQELAEGIASRQEKLIIFTQFRGMISPLHDLLSAIYGRPGLVLHGGVPVPQRQQLVNAFQQEEGPPFFVLSLKAAGTGLTLTQANHVIHFDRWWNPAVENQATDRAYRIGQHRNVLVHRMICRGTIEDRIDHLLKEKQALSDSLFDGGVEKLLAGMTPDEIRKLVLG